LKEKYNKTYNPYSEAQKIIDNMDKVWRDLIAYKKSKNSPLVVLRDGKIEFIDPFTLEKSTASQ
jgi:hypothetical protein